jgi:hypothetical protein
MEKRSEVSPRRRESISRHDRSSPQRRQKGPRRGGEKGRGMGIIVKEEYVCDYCGTGINDERALVGRLSLRKAGARGLARNMQVLLHAECSDKLIRYAKPLAPETKRAKNGSE